MDTGTDFRTNTQAHAYWMLYVCQKYRLTIRYRQMILRCAQSTLVVYSQKKSKLKIEKKQKKTRHRKKTHTTIYRNTANESKNKGKIASSALMLY